MHLDGVWETRSEDSGTISKGDRDGIGDERNTERGALSGVSPSLGHLGHNVDTRLDTERVVAVEDLAYVGIVHESVGELSILLHGG